MSQLYIKYAGKEAQQGTSFLQGNSLYSKYYWTDPLISVDGEIRLWDIRANNQSIHDWRVHSDGLSDFDVHNKAAVFARYVQN